MTEEFLQELKKQSPVLFTIAVLNSRLLKDIEYGEIKLTMYVKNGKIYRIESFPIISKLIET